MSSPGGIDQDLPTGVLSEFAHTLAGRFEVGEVLNRLGEHVVDILGVAGACVSVTDDDGRLRRVTTVNELTVALESLAEEHQEGPCLDAFKTGTVVAVRRVADCAARWPRWSAKAAEHGVCAAIGVPLRVDDQPLGAMNVYSLTERDWQDAELRAAQVLADMASSYVSNASVLEASRRTADQLREALDSRIVIEQAKGALAAERRISVDQAFEVLRSHARRHGASLRTVAEAVVNLGLRPTDEPPHRSA